MNYYNEFDPYAAQWLRNLIAAGHIPQGDVDSRSIKDVKASDLTGYTQCHFFAGLGGWSYALRLAGWPEDRPVWTGSCPCQPFSAAGSGGGVTDERHLWPTWFNLIRECRPDVIFGEQVEAAVNHGWLDLVQSDLEGEGYASGAVGIPAGGVGAPHIRQRLWFVGNSPNARRYAGGEYERSAEMGRKDAPPKRSLSGATIERTGATGVPVANTEIDRPIGAVASPGTLGRGATKPALRGESCELADNHGDGRLSRGTIRPNGEEHDVEHGSPTHQLANGQCEGLEGHAGDERNRNEPGRVNAQQVGSIAPSSWSDCDWLPCRDGKARPVEPGTFPLAHGVSGRVGRLRAYGNAIVPQVAQTFIEAYLES